MTTDALWAVTSDQAWVQAMLDTEVALARAEELSGVAPVGVARAVEALADAALFPIDELAREARLGGNPIIPLVTALRHRLDPAAANWVHHGASSQDILDTAAMLVAARATELIDQSLAELSAGCAGLCSRHRSTLMAGRTLLQHALPITFGLKAAGWLLAAVESRATLGVARKRLPVQLGGAAGTLAALGDRGIRVVETVAAELGLVAAPLPWHSNRTVVVELGAALGLVAGTGAKVAWDVALLMQTEVGEAFEPAAPGRGGSSTLPQKRNPVGAAAVSSAHRQASALVSVLFAGMANEHERALGGWQAEWETLTDLLRLAGGVASKVAETVNGLEVDTDAMSENLSLTGAVLMSERVVFALTPALGHDRATSAVAAAAARARSSGRSFASELTQDEVIGPELTPAEITRLLDPASYLGSTAAFIERALAAYRRG